MSDSNDKNYAESSTNAVDNNKTSHTMFFYLRELCFLFALAITSYAALLNTPQKIGKPPPATPFFPTGSKVTDYYKGNLNEAFYKLSHADVAIIMYYAPWDAKSQAARQEFMAAAEYLHEQITFIAISCWTPFSECKANFPKIKYYPVFVTYLHDKGVQYRGPVESSYIIRYLLTILRPIQRVSSKSDIVQLFTKHDAVVVGSFNFNGNLGGAGYYTFYTSAIKMLEKDPVNEVAFAVTTNSENAVSINVTYVPCVRLFLWNETHDYPLDAEYTDESLTKWIWSKIHQVMIWATLPGVKSYTLSPYLVTGPLLLLVTPRNPLQPIHPVFNMVKELALRYYHCNERSELAGEILQAVENANSQVRSGTDAAPACFATSADNNEATWLGTGMTTVAVVHPNVLLNRTTCDILVSICMTSADDAMCGRGSNRSRDSYSYKTSMLTGWEDGKSTNWLMKLHDRDKCRYKEYRDRHEVVLETEQTTVSDRKLALLTGLSCGSITNRSLSVIAVDSLIRHQFAEALGVPILNINNLTALFIIDGQGESQYVLDKQLTKSSVTDFILDFVVNNSLKRHLRSSEDNSERTITSNKYSTIPSHSCVHTDTGSCVVELNSHSFLTYVLNNTQNVIVMYHTPHCALCRSVSHLYLLLARYLRHFDGLSFARIDGENNDLQWQYVMDVYPSVLFFPAFSKSDSRVFSTDLQFTIRHLIHFTLANLQPEARIPAMVSLCISFGKLQDQNESRRCKYKIEVECLENISKSLKDVRQTSSVRDPRRRRTLINRLNYFRTIHLQLGSVTRLELDSGVVQTIFNTYHDYVHYYNNVYR